MQRMWAAIPRDKQPGKVLRTLPKKRTKKTVPGKQAENTRSCPQLEPKKPSIYAGLQTRFLKSNNLSLKPAKTRF